MPRVHARDLEQVAIDTTLVRYFADAGHLDALIAYLPQAVAVADVLDEVRRQASSPQRQQMGTTLAAHADWPREVAVNLSSEDSRRIQRIQAEWIAEDKKKGKAVRADSHLGELQTIFAAAQEQVPLVVLDDSRARRLAGERRLATKSTYGIALEMTAHGLLTPDQGYAVVEIATGDARRKFDQLLADYGS